MTEGAGAGGVSVTVEREADGAGWRGVVTTTTDDNGRAPYAQELNHVPQIMRRRREGAAFAGLSAQASACAWSDA